MDTAHEPETFRDLILRLRGRTGLTQGRLAERLGISRRSVQDWEAGVNHPTAERLRALITILLEVGALTTGRERAEAQQLWEAVLRESQRMRVPLDEAWLSSQLVVQAAAPLTPEISPISHAGGAKPGALQHAEDWGLAPDVRRFVNRIEERATLSNWLLHEKSRLAAVLGTAGIGKTALAARIAQDVAPNFQRVYWRSLRDSPPVNDWLEGAIRFLSGQQIVTPDNESARLVVLLNLLQERPSLLVLDNFESVLQPNDLSGGYREGHAGYGTLLQTIGEGRHQSCLLLTSRELPPQFTRVGDDAARVLHVPGLQVDAGRALLTGKGLLGNAEEWASLVERFAGNALALRVVGESIREVFAGELGAYLNETDSPRIFGGIRRLLDEQFERSSTVEQSVLRVLTVEREPVSIAHLLAVLGPRYGRGAVIEAVEALRRRSLVERADASGAAAITLQSVALEYVTDRLVEAVAGEIADRRPRHLIELSLIQAQTKDHIRQTQERLIGTPTLERVISRVGRAATEQALLRLLDGWRGLPTDDQAAGPGNVVNLLRLLRGDLHGFDFSYLSIRQAYLAEVDAQETSFVDARLSDTVLAEAFSFPVAVAMSDDGTLLAAGTSTGELRLWRVADRTPVLALRAHSAPVYGVALTADGHRVVSGGMDGTVRVWETSTGREMTTLQAQTTELWRLALSADGRVIASGGEDGSARVWEFGAERPVALLQGCAEGVWTVAVSADGSLLASGGADGMLRLWRVLPTNTWREVGTLEDHTSGVWSVVVSANGELVATGDGEGTVRLWEAHPGESSEWRLVATLKAHTGRVLCLALSAADLLLASSGDDGMVRLWQATDAVEWQPRASLRGHNGMVSGLALSAAGDLLASGGADGTVRLWQATRAAEWYPLANLQGDAGGVWTVSLSAEGDLVAAGGTDGKLRLWEVSTGLVVATRRAHRGAATGVALSEDGRWLASGGADGTLRLWEARADRALATFQGHAGMTWRIAMSADGRLLASGGADGTVRLWSFDELLMSGDLPVPIATFAGHIGGVWSVALSADGGLLASGGADGIVRMWETARLRELTTLRGHTGGVWGVTISADGEQVVSGGEDGILRVWNVRSGRAHATLRGHVGAIYAVAHSANGQLLASGGGDNTVRLWDGSSGHLLATLQGHTGAVFGVAVSADGSLVASGSFDATVKLWDAHAGSALRTLRLERRYERLDITGLTGITDAQRRTLLALGAVDRSGALARDMDARSAARTGPPGR